MTARPFARVLILHLDALRRARPRQLAARVTRPVTRRRLRTRRRPASFSPPAAPVELWRSDAFAAEPIADGSLALLGARIPYPPADWTLPGEPRLRRFHLHYGEEVLEAARRGEGAVAAAALTAWIEGNPFGVTDAWHPYVVATRAGNWIAATALEPGLATPAVRESLWRQLCFLAHNVEHDVLGNHLIRNARALLLGGLAFDDADLLGTGRAILQREIPEQVLRDGGHYERSPVYHLVVLRDLLEVRAALEWSRLDEPIERMKRFAAALVRPDGAPALFNDGSLDLAPALELPAAPAGLSVFPDTGYTILREGSLWLAFDCGVPSPPFLPAHAHADALSFQLWSGGQPIVVDPGTFTYEPGVDRNWFRGTRAHATVTVDGMDQFRLWRAFRAGPLPRVDLLEAGAAGLIARAAYRGVEHVRRLDWDGRRLTVEDEVRGRGTRTLEVAVPLARNADVLLAPVDAFEPGTAWLSERFHRRDTIPTRILRTHRRLPAELRWTLAILAP